MAVEGGAYARRAGTRALRQQGLECLFRLLDRPLGRAWFAAGLELADQVLDLFDGEPVGVGLQPRQAGQRSGGIGREALDGRTGHRVVHIAGQCRQALRRRGGVQRDRAADLGVGVAGENRQHRAGQALRPGQRTTYGDDRIVGQCQHRGRGQASHPCDLRAGLLVGAASQLLTQPVSGLCDGVCPDGGDPVVHEDLGDLG
ncbi:hypothetical protein [Micromonospora sp. DT231]|uniref:hypothetical protein n=1 Tax=Micromonospora sp. DT231 TaxID=3416526 RepID=UPI003CEC8A7F